MGATICSMNLIDEICDEQNLLRSWLHIRGVGEAQLPQKDVNRFESSVARNLASIAQRLREGTWVPGPVSKLRIPKESGGHRTLGVPSIGDRIVERVIASVIDDAVDERLSPWCFAYRRGLSTTDAIAALYEARDDGCSAVVRTDIRDCFDSIPLQRLDEIVTTTIADAAVVRLIRAVLYRSAPDEAPAVGLVQGSPLSPVLCNLYLNLADQQLLRLGMQVVRYADDIAVPIADSNDAPRVLEAVRAAYADLGLLVSEPKTEVATFERGVHFLGATIGLREQTPQISMHAPLESTLYVATPGALLRRKGKRIRIERPDEKPMSVPFARTRQVVILGRVGLTTPFLQMAMQSQIEIVFISDRGNYFGRMDGLVSSDPFLRESQYKRMRDEAFCDSVSRAMIKAKILNQRRLLVHLTRRANRARLSATLQGQAEIVRRLAIAETRPEVMGCEGIAARLYFQAFGDMCGTDWNFHTRQRRPPPDPVNSMLSFGYSILFQEVVSACLAAGLDPYASFLHKPRVGRQGLALDLMEEFRPCVVDSTVMRIIRTKMLTPLDFVVEQGAKPSCRLGAPARKRFLEALEIRFITEFAHPYLGRRISWRQAIGTQAKLLAREVTNDKPNYRPVIWK